MKTAIVYAAKTGQGLTQHAAYGGCLGALVDITPMKESGHFVMKPVLKLGKNRCMAAPDVSLEGVNACTDALREALAP